MLKLSLNSYLSAGKNIFSPVHSDVRMIFIYLFSYFTKNMKKYFQLHMKFKKHSLSFEEKRKWKCLGDSFTREVLPNLVNDWVRWEGDMRALSQSQQVLGKLIGWWLGESKILLGLVKKEMNFVYYLLLASHNDGNLIHAFLWSSK